MKWASRMSTNLSCGDLLKQVFTLSPLHNLQDALALILFVLHPVLKYSPTSVIILLHSIFLLKIRPNWSEMWYEISKLWEMILIPRIKTQQLGSNLYQSSLYTSPLASFLDFCQRPEPPLTGKGHLDPVKISREHHRTFFDIPLPHAINLAGKTTFSHTKILTWLLRAPPLFCLRKQLVAHHLLPFS